MMANMRFVLTCLAAPRRTATPATRMRSTPRPRRLRLSAEPGLEGREHVWGTLLPRDRGDERDRARQGRLRRQRRLLHDQRLRPREPEVHGITFTDIRARQGDSSYIWAWKGKPFKDIVLRNVDLNGGLEVINVNGFRIEGGTAKVTALSEKTLGERNRMLETCTEFIW